MDSCAGKQRIRFSSSWTVRTSQLREQAQQCYCKLRQKEGNVEKSRSTQQQSTRSVQLMGGWLEMYTVQLNLSISLITEVNILSVSWNDSEYYGNTRLEIFQGVTFWAIVRSSWSPQRSWCSSSLLFLLMHFPLSEISEFDLLFIFRLSHGTGENKAFPLLVPFFEWLDLSFIFPSVSFHALATRCPLCSVVLQKISWYMCL